MSFIKKNLINIFVIILFSILLYDSLFNSLILPESLIVREHSFYYFFLLFLFILMLPNIVKYYNRFNIVIYFLIFHIIFINIIHIYDFRSFFENVSSILLSFLCYLYGYSIGLKHEIKTFVKIDYSFLVIIILLFIIQNINQLIILFTTGNINSDFIFCLLIYLPLLSLVSNKILKLIGMIFILIMVILSGKRSALLAYLVFFIVFFFIYIVKYVRIKKIFIYIFIISAIIILLSSIFSEQIDFIVERFENIKDDQGSGRVGIYQSIINNFYESSFLLQLLGHGHRAAYYINNIFAHSDYIQLLYDYGIIGLFTYILFLISFFRRRVGLSKTDLFYYAIAISTLFFYVVIGLLNCIIYSAVYLSFILLVIGMCLGEIDNKKI